MRLINPARAAFSVGLVIALYHAAWAALLATGAAKPFLDYVLRLHSFDLDYTLTPFDADTAVMLVVVTYAVGALFGLVFALIWNWLAGSPTSHVREQPRQRSLWFDQDLAN